MKNEAYEGLIRQALRDMYREVNALERVPLMPHQIRSFVVVPNRIEWPVNNDLRKFRVPGKFRYEHGRYIDGVARIIMSYCPTPRHVFHVLQRIRSITAWCRAKLKEVSNGK